MPLLTQQIDLYQPPAFGFLLEHLEDANHVTIGDLHSNAIYLLWILKALGILNCSIDNYNRLVDIYKNAGNL